MAELGLRASQVDLASILLNPIPCCLLILRNILFGWMVGFRWGNIYVQQDQRPWAPSLSSDRCQELCSSSFHGSEQGHRSRVRGKASCPPPTLHPGCGHSARSPRPSLMLSSLAKKECGWNNETMRRYKGCQASRVPFSSWATPTSLVGSHFGWRGPVGRLFIKFK